MRAFALVLLIAAFPAAAGAKTRIPLKPLPHVSAGRVDGTRAFVAVSVHGRFLRVYACDGTLRRDPTISVWFKRRDWDGGDVTLRQAGHTLRLHGRTGTLDGHAFRVRRVSGRAGLFRGHAGHTRATWIILRGDHKRGTMVPTRPPKCRFVLVSGPNGSQQWVSVCG